MKYERMATNIEAMQYDGDRIAAEKFCVEHSDKNRDMSNRPDPTRKMRYGTKIEIWVEKSSAYFEINVGDYIVAEVDGNGVYVHNREGFERAHIPLGIDA